MSGRQLAIAAAAAAVLLGALDAYVVVGVLTDLIRDLQIPVNRLERATPIVTGYLLGYVAAMPLLGQLSDRLGRRAVLSWCLAAFAAASIITAVATTLPVLVAGRVLQGAAGGALLPVTMALVADLFPDRKRITGLGIVGAAQEAGSVLGTLYGLAIATAFGAWSVTASLQPQGWRWIFWINVPLSLFALLMVRATVPSGHRRPDARADVIGGVLLAVGLAVLVVALYNPDPAHTALPPWGWPLMVVAVVAFGAFAAWERRSPVRLLDTRGLRLRPLFAVLGASLLSGAALLVTLVDVELFAQTVLGDDSARATLALSPFLAALPVGAVLGGWFARRFGDRPVAVIGFVVSTGAYLLIAQWTSAVRAVRHLGLPAMPTDLVIAGLGLGLVIAPLASAVLRVTRAADHGVAAAAVVVSRTAGMLIGVAALTAWGLYRFNQLTATLNTPLPFDMTEAAYSTALAEYQRALGAALTQEYSEIFLITAGLCALAALVAVLLPTRSLQVSQPAPVAAVGP